MRHKLTVCVGIPCFNGAKYLPGCIESVLNQTRKPDEILVVDDGSTDSSCVVASRYPVKVIRHEVNKGLGKTRNTIVKNTRCEVVAFLDVDCVVPSHWLECIVRNYKAGIGGVGGCGIETVTKRVADRYRTFLWKSQGFAGQQVREVNWLVGMNCSFRVDALRQAGLFDGRLKTNAEDIDMGLRLRKLGWKILYDPSIVVFHLREDSLRSLFTTAYRVALWVAFVFFKNRYRSRLEHLLRIAPSFLALYAKRFVEVFCSRQLYLLPLILLEGLVIVMGKLKAILLFRRLAC
jgi:glycosyltransferase involved in cell wall biosynthesis